MSGTKGGTKTGQSTSERPVPNFDGRIWYVLMSEPNRETFAMRNLLRVGFTAWLPICSRVTRHARRVEIKRAPFFPGYLFVGRRPEQGFAPIITAMGVASVIRGDGGRPVEIRRALLEGVAVELARHEGLQLATPVPKASPFHKGQRLRVTGGPFLGFEGLCTMTAGQRVAVLLSIFGQDTTTVLPSHMLRATD